MLIKRRTAMLQEYVFPAFAGLWLAGVFLVVFLDVIRRVRNENKENDKKLGK